MQANEIEKEWWEEKFKQALAAALREGDDGVTPGFIKDLLLEQNRLAREECLREIRDIINRCWDKCEISNANLLEEECWKCACSCLYYKIEEMK